MADFGIKLAADDAIKQLEANLEQAKLNVAQATTSAIRDVGTAARDAVRNNIRSNSRFPRSWAGRVHARFSVPYGGTPSMKASVRIRGESPLNFLGVFEVGATIYPKKRALLWLPLTKTIPGHVTADDRMTPDEFKRLYGPLKSARNSRVPLLLAQIVFDETGSALSKEQRRFRHIHARKAKWIPVFVGITAAQLKKHLRYEEILAQAQNSLPEKYAEYMAELTR